MADNAPTKVCKPTWLEDAASEHASETPAALVFDEAFSPTTMSALRRFEKITL
jgi:hypothetical protein